MKIPWAKGYLLVFSEDTRDGAFRDETLLRLTCYVLNDLQLSHRAERTCLDRVLDNRCIEDAKIGGVELVVDERGYMAEEIIRANPMNGSTQDCVLLPAADIATMQRAVVYANEAISSERRTTDKRVALWRRHAMRLLKRRLTDTRRSESDPSQPKKQRT